MFESSTFVYALVCMHMCTYVSITCAHKQGDTGGKETAKGSRRSKQMTNNKESPHHISTSSDNGDMVTMDTTNSNTSIHHSNSSDTVVDVTRDAKRIKKLRKRSLPAMNSSNDVDGGSKAKKKHKSLDSRLVDTITKKVMCIHKCTVSTYICN